MNSRSKFVTNSTFKVPNSIINTGKILQFFSTSSAASFAMKLFTTPPKFETPERELMMRKSAKNIPITIPGIEHEIMVYEYGFSKTKILLAHGWSGRGTQLYEVADKLLENGMMVIAYDAPAHGQSGGKRTYLIDNMKVVEYLAENYGPFEAAIGHSFGGITLLNAQAKQPLFKKIITIGIEGSMYKIIDEFVKKIELKSKVSSKMKTAIKRNYNKDVETISGNEAAKKIDIPVLVLHDTKDNDVDVSSAFKLRQNLRNGLLVITNGLGHRKILRDQKVINRIIAFLKT
ncbi:MAG: alpha/beta hydrolase [Flavobacteriaceae bacterium]|nr:alpha/beta hydrolase [Flavobacteriaceae bacterium]